MTMKNNDVFFNCPFDQKYKPLLRASYFTVTLCGFKFICAYEKEAGNVARLEKICRQIESSTYSIHDVSRKQDESNGFPRFNMPFEYGIVFGVDRVSRDQRHVLVMDDEKHQYDIYFSDISGFDISSHDNDVEKIVEVIRNFLSDHIKGAILPLPNTVYESFKDFEDVLNRFCTKNKWDVDKLIYSDFKIICDSWIINHAPSSITVDI